MEQVLAFLTAAVQELLQKKSRIILAIDGRCAAGKTTLAKSFCKAVPAAVFHMDDFFLRPEQRTPERLREPGGNVDRERFLEEVLLPLTEGRPFTYRPFDCGTRSLGAPVAAEPAAVTVIEGSYSCHPDLAQYYDLRVFLTLSPEAQAARILRRNGPEQAAVFRQRWIPMEEQYFAAFGIEAQCRGSFDTTKETEPWTE